MGGHGHDLRGASKRSLKGALILIVGYMFVEVVGGVLSGSLALLADAGHMLTDAASIGLALAALHFSSRAASAEKTFGYRRLEVLAALINALTLWLIAGGVVLEAWHRFRDVPDVEGGLMLIVGSIGLLVNIAAARILHKSAEHSVNVEGAFRHVIADLLGSVGVVVSGVLVWAFGWTLADPILSVIIAVLILSSTWRLLGKVIHLLLQGTPEHIDVYRLCSEIEDVEGVLLIHDVHVWSLAQDYDVFTAHILIDPEVKEVDRTSLLRRLQRIVYHDFGIHHVTIQLEDSAEECAEHHHVDHLHAHSRPHRNLTLIQRLKKRVRRQ